jgi:threonylcarbamoyladenosine tRNA methylthiotransferase MtaB
MAQLDPAGCLDIAGVSWVAGNAYKDSIVSLIEMPHGTVLHSTPETVVQLSSENAAAFNNNAEGRTRFTVKIQEGCDCRCAYCIVPLLRGVSRSVSFDNVVSAFKNAVESGYREIVITGTHIGQYFDKASGIGFERLVETLASVNGDFRLRLSSLNPGDITDSLCDIIASNHRICDHLHISVQSLVPEILEKMNRSPQLLKRCLKMLNRLRVSRPRLSVGLDLITGFPGESRGDFLLGIDNLFLWGISYAHVFRFSRRPGTQADAMQCQIDEKEKTDRSAALRSAVAVERRRFIKNQIGTVHNVLAEQTDPVSGLSSNYLRIEAPGAVFGRNQRVDIMLKEFDEARNICIGHAV